MYYTGVDLGGTNIAVGIVDANGSIKAKASVKTHSQRPFREIIRDMADCINKLIKSSNISWEDIRSIGIGAPGTLDTASGTLIYANNFAESTNIPIRKILNEYIDKPVYLGNDANAAALGEVICGAAKGAENAVMVTIGTGVGGGIVINGKIYEGQYSAGGEIGHIMLIKDGEQCSCGRRGCWEAYASATALVRQTKQAMKNNPESYMNKITDLSGVNGRTAFIAAEHGDIAAKKVVDSYIEYVAEGITDLVNIFRPEVIIIGGGVCNEGDRLLVPITELVNRFKYAGDRLPDQTVKKAALGNNAGIIGAALMKK